jgi:hypothetical protein
MKRKFDKGGSVMDKPSRDMRDPKYRKQLEREQALETSAPELMLVGPGGASSGFTRLLKPAPKPSGAAPEIGSKLPEAILQRHTEYYKNLGGGKLSKDSVGSLAKQAADAEVRQAKNQASILRGTPQERRARKIAEATDEIAKGAARPVGVEYLTRRKEEGMKKGGRVKSASARADGIAVRGKTRA